jgi:hypothetical protein
MSVYNVNKLKKKRLMNRLIEGLHMHVGVTSYLLGFINEKCA